MLRDLHFRLSPMDSLQAVAIHWAHDTPYIPPASVPTRTRNRRKHYGIVVLLPRHSTRSFAQDIVVGTDVQNPPPHWRAFSTLGPESSTCEIITHAHAGEQGGGNEGHHVRGVGDQGRIAGEVSVPDLPDMEGEEELMEEDSI